MWFLLKSTSIKIAPTFHRGIGVCTKYLPHQNADGLIIGVSLWTQGLQLAHVTVPLHASNVKTVNHWILTRDSQAWLALEFSSTFSSNLLLNRFPLYTMPTQRRPVQNRGKGDKIRQREKKVNHPYNWQVPSLHLLWNLVISWVLLLVSWNWTNISSSRYTLLQLWNWHPRNTTATPRATLSSRFLARRWSHIHRNRYTWERKGRNCCAQHKGSFAKHVLLTLSNFGHLKQGEVILREKPLFVVPRNSM
jgi:hypothetical protein